MDNTERLLEGFSNIFSALISSMEAMHEKQMEALTKIGTELQFISEDIDRIETHIDKSHG